MPLIDDDELTGMLSDWGDTATYGVSTFDVMLVNEYIETSEMSGYSPVAYCRNVDVSGIAGGDSITVNGDSYLVAVPEFDSTKNLKRLVLEEV